MMKPQFINDLITIVDYESREKEEIGAMLQRRISDRQRTHPEYKFDKLFYDFPEESGNMHIDLKFVLHNGHK